MNRSMSNGRYGSGVQTRDGRLVTPEAVVLRFETAGLGSRILARALDTVIQLAFALVLLLVLALVRSASASSLGTPLVIVFLLGVFLDLFAYTAVLETVWRGRTIGKRALGIRVVTREGAPVRFRHAAIRSAFWIIDGFLLGGPSIGVVTMLLTRQSLRTGDIVAGTIVVRERSGARPPAAVTFTVPPGYEPYADGLDAGTLSPSLYEAVRAFLLRAPSLDQKVRYPLAASLAGPIAVTLHQAPPPWIGPELFLVCVAAGYQRRHGMAGWGQPPPTWGAPAPTWPAPAPTWGQPPPPPAPAAAPTPAPIPGPAPPPVDGSGGFTPPP
jgi:uncharacterized RDD family membrane protein YckC